MAPQLIRPFGAVVGAVLALGLILLLYLASAAPAIEALTYLRETLDGQTIVAGGLPVRSLAWSVGPAAAAVAGWTFANAAASQTRRVGSSMGALTFGLTLLGLSLGASLTISGLENGSGPGGFLTVPVLALAAGLALAPLFLVCVVAGNAWAVVIRRFTNLPAAEPEIVRRYRWAFQGIVAFGVMSALATFLFQLVTAALTGYPTGTD